MSDAPGSGSAQGPTVESLTRRLLDTPGDFLAVPFVRQRGAINVAAVVSDLLMAYGGPSFDTTTAQPFRPADGPTVRNELSCVLVAAWLLQDPWFVARGPTAEAYRFLATGLRALAAHVPAPLLVSDPARREELARLTLAALGLVPDGETPAVAADRLATLDSVERARVVAATAEAERRAEAVRQAMHDKAAAEAAAKASRE
jgi:hypothetical protein